MNIQEALGLLLERQSLNSANMTSVMQQVMTGEATPAQIGAFLAALRMKGETVDEVAAAAKVMRSLATGVSVSDDNAVDIVGTGGDTSHTFNVSTCSSLVTAAAGVKVAKHGNRSVSSNSGAADLLEAAGVNVNLSPEQVAQCVEQIGVGFMFAIHHHSAMKHAIGPRREMGVRTLFNLLGPLTNPAGVSRQLVGVYDASWVRPVADVLLQLGSVHSMVVHGDAGNGGGMDEISVSGATSVAELKDGQVHEYSLSPGDFGMPVHPIDAIQVQDAAQSLGMIEAVLANKDCAATDVVLLNAGAAIYTGGVANTHADGIDAARAVLADGSAQHTLAALVELSQGFAGE